MVAIIAEENFAGKFAGKNASQSYLSYKRENLAILPLREEKMVKIRDT
jgi:hypothetical protein